MDEIVVSLYMRTVETLTSISFLTRLAKKTQTKPVEMISATAKFLGHNTNCGSFFALSHIIPLDGIVKEAVKYDCKNIKDIEEFVKFLKRLKTKLETAYPYLKELEQNIVKRTIESTTKHILLQCQAVTTEKCNEIENVVNEIKDELLSQLQSSFFL